MSTPFSKYYYDSFIEKISKLSINSCLITKIKTNKLQGLIIKMSIDRIIVIIPKRYYLPK